MSAHHPLKGSPTDTQQALDREAHRLLAALDESGAVAERLDERIRVMVKRRGITMQACAVPAGALASLLSSGAVMCRSRGGRSCFEITPEGRQKLVRSVHGADGFQRQHQDAHWHCMMRDGEAETVLVNEREDPLDWLRRHPGKGGQAAISSAGFEAGARLRRDLHLAQTMPRVTSNWSRLAVDASRNTDAMVLSERALAAKMRVERAFEAIDPSFCGLLIDICGFSKGLDLIERERGWPARSAKLVLKLALDALAAHYGLSNAARGPDQTLSRYWNDGDRASIPAAQARAAIS